eukprot:1540625-Lingulodinium_polyedra.AAC.1
MPTRAPTTLVKWRWFSAKNLMALMSSGNVCGLMTAPTGPCTNDAPPAPFGRCSATPRLF